MCRAIGFIISDMSRSDMSILDERRWTLVGFVAAERSARRSWRTGPGRPSDSAAAAAAARRQRHADRGALQVAQAAAQIFRTDERIPAARTVYGLSRFESSVGARAGSDTRGWG